MTAYLDDPRRIEADGLARAAEGADRLARYDDAMRLYAQAATIEEAVAKSVPVAQPKLRSVLAVSAVALWAKAGRVDDVRRLAAVFMRTPEGLTFEAVRAMTNMLADASARKRR